jgi:RES domain-containing protein
MHGKPYEVFDATGASRFGGRWHSAGTRVIYAAEHASLAVLETLIHAGGKKLPPKVITEITLPDDLKIEDAIWMETPQSQAFGDLWARELRSAVLRVPSIAVNKMERNFVLNPGHPEFARVAHKAPQIFIFDTRLAR